MKLPWQKQVLPKMAYKMASWMMSMGALRQMQTTYIPLATEGYGVNPIVRACVEKVATAFGSVDWVLYRRRRDGKIEKVDGEHPLKTLIERPNPRASGRQFLGDLVRYRLIGGSAFILGAGLSEKSTTAKKNQELYLLSPQFVTVEKNPNGQFPKSYKYAPTGGAGKTYQVDQITGFSAVMQSKAYNPIDNWAGYSPMIAAASLIDVFNEGQKWNAKLLQHDCRPAGALMVKGKDGTSQSLTEEQYTRLKSQLEENMSGANNAGKPLLLEGGLEWIEMSVNAKDMDHKENMLNAARGIAGVFGVPPMLINIPGESTYANYEQARMALWTDTVLPLLSEICDEFNNWIVPLYGEEFFFWYDEEMIPALEPLRKQKAERVNSAGFMSVDEKRQAMGLDDLPDGVGNVILVPSTNIPLDLAGEVDLPEPGSPSDTVKGDDEKPAKDDAKK